VSGDNAGIFFDGLSGGSRLGWRVNDSDGRQVYSGTLEYHTFVALESGDFVLTVSGTSDSTGDYSFRLLENEP
jgi:hypothetical protein